MLELIVGNKRQDIMTNNNSIIKGNVYYKTSIPFHHFKCPFQSIHREVKNNNQGIIDFRNSAMNRAHIINTEIKYLENRGSDNSAHHWAISGVNKDEFVFAPNDYNDIVSIATHGFIGSFDYFGNSLVDVLFWVVPCNDDTAEGKLMRFGRNIFEDYPDPFYKIVKNTADSLVVRYHRILDDFPMSLESYPMLTPLEYILQEIYQNRYIVENIAWENGENKDVRVPVIRFWESGVSTPQYYTYEYYPVECAEDSFDDIVEIKFEKTDKKQVVQGSDCFLVDCMY